MPDRTRQVLCRIVGKRLTTRPTCHFGKVIWIVGYFYESHNILGENVNGNN